MTIVAVEPSGCVTKYGVETLGVGATSGGGAASSAI